MSNSSFVSELEIQERTRSIVRYYALLFKYLVPLK